MIVHLAKKSLMLISACVWGFTCIICRKTSFKAIVHPKMRWICNLFTLMLQPCMTFCPYFYFFVADKEWMFHIWVCHTCYSKLFFCVNYTFKTNQWEKDFRNRHISKNVFHTFLCLWMQNKAIVQLHNKTDFRPLPIWQVLFCGAKIPKVPLYSRLPKISAN